MPLRTQTQGHAVLHHFGQAAGQRPVTILDATTSKGGPHQEAEPQGNARERTRHTRTCSISFEPRSAAAR